MDGIKVLHTGDLHLGMSFARSKLPAEIGRVRRQELWETFDRIIDTAKAEEVDLLLIAGDLFEYNYCTASDIKRINDRFARIPGTRVLIAPGNHDPALPDSLYNTCRWQPNVHIFRSSDICALELEGLGTTVWGLGWDRDYIVDPLLEGFKVSDDGINVLLAHGEVVPEGTTSDYLPIYLRHLAECGADYAALGHVHKGGVVEHGGRGTARYCTSPEPISFNEDGDHGICIGTLGKGFCDVKFLPIAKRRFITRRINPDPAGDAAEVLEQMKGHIMKEGEENLYRFLLEGAMDPGADLDTTYLAQAAQAFHVEVKNNTYADYDLDAIMEEDQNSIMGAFAAKILDQLDSESDLRRRAVLERALYIGLDALNGRKVVGR